MGHAHVADKWMVSHTETRKRDAHAGTRIYAYMPWLPKKEMARTSKTSTSHVQQTLWRMQKQNKDMAYISVLHKQKTKSARTSKWGPSRAWQTLSHMQHSRHYRKSLNECNKWMKQMNHWMNATNEMTYMTERWGAGVEYHFQEFNEPYAPSYMVLNNGA